MHKFSEGLTYEYVIHGVFLVTGGFVFSAIHPLFLIVVILGVSLILIRSTIEIDTVNMQFRKVLSVGLFKKGKWYKLENFTKIKLSYNSQSHPTYRPIYLNKSPSTLRTFDLIFEDKANKFYLFNDFTDLNLATKVLKAFSALNVLPVESNVPMHNNRTF